MILTGWSDPISRLGHTVSSLVSAKPHLAITRPEAYLKSDAAEMPGYGEHHDYGRAIEYGQKHKRVPHRTPDSLANSQQLRLFDPDKPYGEQADAYLRDLEERASIEEELGFKPFDQEP